MNEIWGVLAAVLSSALGGTSIGATRFLVDAMDPLAIGSFRFGIGFVLLLPLALLQAGIGRRAATGSGSRALASCSSPRFPSCSTLR